VTNPNPAGLSVGAVIGGRYEIIPYRPPENPSQERGYIGAGGMGVVYLAIDNRLDRKIAIKTTLKADEDSAARFVREIKAAASLNHPGIVQPLDCGTENGIAYFAMEFVEGGRSLHAWIQEHKKNATKSSLDVVVDLFVRISDALWCIHDAGFVHRDIKPSNILLMRMPHRDELVPKISDFGVVRSFEGGEMNLTLTGQACGTPHYQSPETVRYLRGDDVVLDARVDLWALVVSLCECLTCAKPFNGQDATQAHKAVLEHRPLWPSEARDDIERGMHIDHICMKGLEKDPTLRFHNAKDLHHALMHVNQLPIYAGDNLKTSVALGGSAAGNAHLLVMPELNNGLRFPGETVAAKKPEPNNNIVQNNQPPPSVTDADPDEAPQDSAPLRDASPATAENRLPRRTLVPVLAIAAVPALLLFVGLTMLGGGAEPQFSEPTITTDDAQEPYPDR